MPETLGGSAAQEQAARSATRKVVRDLSRENLAHAEWVFVFKMMMLVKFNATFEHGSPGRLETRVFSCPHEHAVKTRRARRGAEGVGALELIGVSCGPHAQAGWKPAIRPAGSVRYGFAASAPRRSAGVRACRIAGFQPASAAALSD